VHPNSNALDDTPLPGTVSQYATRHNPFIYFHSLLDLGDCSSDDVTLDRLPNDLRSISKTPSFAFVAPGACDDAAALACPASSSTPSVSTPSVSTSSGSTPSVSAPSGTTTTPDQPVGLAAEDAFLKLWVPKILGSPAYARDGALMIVFTASPPATGHASTDHPVRTGALILSRFARAARTLTGAYDPYSVLRSVEELFGYTLLAHARDAKSFVTSALPGA
jgi:phosphatidylinositol-3-phosphatase